MSKTKTENELIKLLQQKKSISYARAIEKYCAQHTAIDISRGSGQLHSIVDDEHFRDLIGVLEKLTTVTDLRFQNQQFQDTTLRQLTKMLNNHQNITTLTNKHGTPLTIDRETQRWEFNEADHDITLVGINEEAPHA